MPDYGCYITIKNSLDCSLTFLNYGADHGYWKVDPPQNIGAKSTSSQFRLADHLGGRGSDGWVRYRVDLPDAVDDSSKPVIRVHFADPTGNNDNEFDASATVKDGSTTSCHLFAFSNTDYPKRDHPLTVTLTINYDLNLTTTSQLYSISVPRPVVLVRNSRGVAQIGANLVVWKSDNVREYEDNTDDSVVGSFYPVAIDVANTSLTSRVIDVYVDVDGQMLGVPFILYGGNDAADNVASSDSSQPLVFYTSGRQRVRVAVSPPWESTDKPWAVVGAINWRLKVIPTSQIISINSARLEFYAITKNLPYFYKKVVPVKLLRRFVIPFRDNSTSWVTYCCQQTFANFSFLYDSYNGGAFYARQNTGGSFRLASYLDDIGRQTMLNCYDQASIMQICLGLSPNTNTAGYVYMSNFGWIVTTPLVGRGRTNNPFYLNSQCNHSIICDNNAPNRSRFANHAFVSLKPNDKDKIVDACNGPHNGNGNLQAYITAAIQTMDDTTLYRAQDKKPGTVNDADFKVSGVTNFEGTTATTAVKMATTVTKAIDSPSLPLPGAPRFLEGVEHMINLAKGSGSAIAERRSNAALADFFDDAIVSRQGFSIARSSIAASANGTDAEWVLKSNDGNDDISVSVFLAAGGLLDAIVAFGNHLGTYTRALDGMFREPEDPHSLRGQLNLESVGAGNGEEESKLTLLWVYGNVFVHIAHRSGGPHHNGPRIRELADELHKHISEGAKPLDSDEVVVPRIRKISGPEGPVAVGDTFIVRISLEGKSYTTVDCKAGLAVLMEHNQAEGYFKFYAAESGSETISFNFAHQSTLNSTTRELEVEVKEA